MIRSFPAALALALLTGCGWLAPHPVANNGDRCAGLAKDSDVKADEGRIAVLIDVSNSTRASTAGLGAPVYTGGLARLMNEAVERGDRVTVGSFSGTVSGLDPVGLRTRSASDNTTNRQHDAKVARDCLTEALTRAARQDPAKAGTDVLAALREAVDWVRGGKSTKSVILATDGLSTTGCADLTKAAFSGRDELTTIVAVCKQRKEIRAGDLTGVRLTMIGVGRGTPEQPAASPEQLDWLRQLWAELCAAGGGTDCGISTAAVSGKDSPPPAVPGVADPVVGFARVFTIKLPAAALFDTDKWELRPDARASLERIAVDLRTLAYSKVEVAGHADARGDPGANLLLSQRRAAAVAAFLQEHRVTLLSTIGYGEQRPVCTTSTDDECLQQNRRVEIIVHRT